MDGLTEQERSEAWKSAYRISFDGWAIVDKDFVFRSVNPQWMELLGVLPSEFIGKTFEDITPIEVRELDAQNAQLVIEGKINSYLMHKSYRFRDGTQKDIVLLVTRVPINTEKPFQFFLSRILLDPKENQSTTETNYPSDISDPSMFKSMIDFLSKYWMWIATASAIVTGIIAKLLGVHLDTF